MGARVYVEDFNPYSPSIHNILTNNLDNLHMDFYQLYDQGIINNTGIIANGGPCAAQGILPSILKKRKEMSSCASSCVKIRYSNCVMLYCGAVITRTNNNNNKNNLTSCLFMRPLRKEILFV